MKSFLRVFLAAAAGLISFVSFASALEVPGCKSGTPEMEYTQCVSVQVRVQDARLNDVWARLVKRVKTDFSDSPGVYESLKASEQAWIKFRDKSCEFETFGARAGSQAENHLRQLCLYRMTRDRASYLEAVQYP